MCFFRSSGQLFMTKKENSTLQLKRLIKFTLTLLYSCMEEDHEAFRSDDTSLLVILVSYRAVGTCEVGKVIRDQLLLKIHRLEEMLRNGKRGPSSLQTAQTTGCVTAKRVCFHMKKSAGVILLHTTDSKNRRPAQSQKRAIIS